MNVSGLSFFVSDPGPVRRAAITHAVTTARADAEALATAAGGRLGEILEMSTTPIMVQPVFARGMMAKGGAADMAMQTPVEPGQETVEAMVSVRFRFVPGR